MKFKKVLSLVLVSALAGSLVGCSGSTTSSTTTGTDTTADNSKTESAATETAATTEADTDTAEVDLSDIIPDETVTLNVYSQLANYEGEQIGWFAQIMKDKFNVKLNIIRDYEVVEKREVRLPEELRGIVKCANPKCITNNEPMPTLFHVVDKDNCVIKCHYCEKEQTREDIEII